MDKVRLISYISCLLFDSVFLGRWEILFSTIFMIVSERTSFGGTTGWYRTPRTQPWMNPAHMIRSSFLVTSVTQLFSVLIPSSGTSTLTAFITALAQQRARWSRVWTSPWWAYSKLLLDEKSQEFTTLISLTNILNCWCIKEITVQENNTFNLHIKQHNSHVNTNCNRLCLSHQQ